MVLFLLYCIDKPESLLVIGACVLLVTHQSSPSSIPSPLIAQLPRTLQSRPFSPPANPNCSLISSGLSAPSISCLLQNTSRGTPASSSSDNIVSSSDREVCNRDTSEES